MTDKFQKDIKNLINNIGIVGCAAGSIFVFKGKYRAVLIQYPNNSNKRILLPSSSATPHEKPTALLDRLAIVSISLKDFIFQL